MWLENSTVCNEVTGSLDGRLAIRVNDWVTADYEGVWYIGQVQQIDEQDGEVEVSLTTKSKGKAAASSFKSPAQKKSCGWKERMFSVLLRPPFLSAKPAAPSS